MSKIISVVSFKGGVGKTTTAVNLGSVLSRDFNKKVLVVDTNFSSPGVGLHFGMTNQEHTLQDVLMNEAELNKAVYKVGTGLYVMPASLLSKNVNVFSLRNKLNDLRQFYDFIILDTAPALTSSTIESIAASDEALVVSHADYLGLSATLKAVQLANQKKVPVRGVVLNQTSSRSFELSKDELEQASNTKVIANIPFSKKFGESLSEASSLVLHQPDSSIAKLYNSLASRFADKKDKKDPFKNKLKKLFKKEITKEAIDKLLIENELK